MPHARCRTVRTLRTLRTLRGFTLIELIAVVVIVGVLSLVAGSAYTSLARDSYLATTEAAAAAFADGMKLAKATWYARTDASGAVVDMPGYADGTVDFAAHGYPQGTSVTTPGPAELSSTACAELFNAVVKQARAVARDVPYDGHGYQFAVLGLATACQFRPLTADGRLMIGFTDPLFVYSESPDFVPSGGRPGSIEVYRTGATVDRSLILP